MLTIPAEAVDCVMFLAVSDGEKLHFGGTAFVASVSGPENRYFPYLVTARHNIELAKRREGRLVARYNVEGGNAILDLSGSEVLTPDEAGVDVALIADLDWDAVIKGGRVRHLSLYDIAASGEFVKDNDIGIGTEVLPQGSSHLAVAKGRTSQWAALGPLRRCRSNSTRTSGRANPISPIWSK